MIETKIHTLLSDLALEKWIIDNVKNRIVEQKYIYLWKWAQAYYNAYSNSQFDPEQSDIFDFISKYLDKKNKFAIISLGCWNASQEKKLLTDLKSNWIDFTYFWVDISRSMLDLAIENLQDLDVDKRFIFADIMSEDFKQEIVRLTRWYSSRFYCFLWRTFCNTNQTNVTDSFYNLLSKEDYLLFDVYTRKEDDNTVRLKIFNRYSEYLKPENISKTHFQFSILDMLWIPRENGKFKLDMKKEDSIWALVFTFWFFFEKKTKIVYRNEQMNILKGETVELYNIRNYFTDKFLNFFKEHDFHIVEYYTKPYKEDWLYYSQFLFKKS